MYSLFFPPLVHQGAGIQPGGNTLAMFSRDSHTQHTLHSHGVRTMPPILEETAGAVPDPMIIVGGMDIVLTPKLGFEACELDTLRLFRIALGFCNFADHA